MAIVVALKLEKLQFQIRGRPKERMVQALAPHGADQPFDEGMRERRVRHRLDFLKVKNPQIRLPLVKAIQRIMIRAEVGRRSLAVSRPIEHATHVHAIDDAAVHEIPALPGDDEVAAIAAEQEAGAEAEAQAEAAAEADADAAAQSADNQKADAAESDKSAPAADDGKDS